MINFLKFYTKHSNKVFLIFFLVITTFASLLESFSILAVLPIINILLELNANEVTKYILFMENFNFLNIEVNEKFLLIISFSIIIMSSVINFINVILLQFNTYRTGQNISVKLFKSYLNKNYNYFLNKNSSELTKNLISESQRLTDGIILQFLTLIPKIISTSFIVVVLLFYNLKITTYIILIFLIFYCSYYFLIKKKLLNLGRGASEYLNSIHQVLKESFSLIDVIKIRNKNFFFIKKYFNSTNSFANYNISSSLLSIFPKYLFEFVFFACLLLILLNFYETNTNLIQLIPTLGLYFFAFFRLMPHIQSIYQSFSTFNLNLNSFEIIRSDINSIINKKDKKFYKEKQEFEKIIIKNITFKYVNTKNFFKIKNFQIKKGEKIAIIGRSGTGKSTFLKILCGLLNKNEGYFEIFGKNNRPIDKKQFFTTSVSYLTQNIFLLDENIANNVAFGEKNINYEEVYKNLSLSNFPKLKKKHILNNLIGDNGIKLSGGQRQRLAIARLLYENNNFFILDEFDNALDKENIKIISKLFFLNDDKTIIFSTHNQDLLKNADKIYEFKNNKLVNITL